MLRLLVASTTFLFLIASSATAAPRPDQRNDGPALIGQAKSFNDLLDMTKAMVKNVGGDAFYKMFEKEALPNLDPAHLPGIDPKRPFGLYGIAAAELVNWRGVILIPVTGEKNFLDMLEQFELKPVKSGPGAYVIPTPPDFPIPIALKFHKDYAYVAFGGADVLDSKLILDPRDVINDKEKGIAYFSIRPDRIPPEVRKFVLANLREQIELLKEQIPDEDLKASFSAVERMALRWIKTLFEEGKEIALRFDADTKTGDVYAELTVEGTAKSALTAEFAKRLPTKNAFASLAGNDYAQRFFVSAPLFADESKEALLKLIDWATKESIKEVARNAPIQGVTLVEAAFKSLKATVESGEMDLGAALRGPNKDGFYTAVGAVHCKEGAQLEKALREAVNVFPEKERSFFKFDAGKIGEVNVHEIDLSSEAAEVAVKIFGKGQKAYFAFATDALYASYGPDGMKLLKEAMNAKPGAMAVMDSSSDAKKTADLMKRILPENQAGGGGGPVMAFGMMAMTPTAMRVTVDGGDKLKVRVSYNVGLMFMMLGWSFRAEPAGAAPVAVPAGKKD